LPLRLFLDAGRQHRLDRARAVFQRPVATARSGTGEVGAGRNVGAGQRRQVLHQLPAGGALRHVAAVKQQVGVSGQCLAPAGDLTGALHQRVGIQHRAAKLQMAVAAVAEHMHGADVAAPGERLAHQGQAVGAGVDGHDLDAAPGGLLHQQVGGQRVGVGQAGVDEGDLGALRGGLRRCRCSRGRQRGLVRCRMQRR